MSAALNVFDSNGKLINTPLRRLAWSRPLERGGSVPILQEFK